MKTSTETMTMALIAIVAAMGLIGVVAIDILTPLHEVEARGCHSSVPYNASQGRCFRP